MAEANQMITNAGFNINIMGEVSNEQTELIVEQDPLPDSLANTGSIVTIVVEQKQAAGN